MTCKGNNFSILRENILFPLKRQTMEYDPIPTWKGSILQQWHLLALILSTCSSSPTSVLQQHLPCQRLQPSENVLVSSGSCRKWLPRGSSLRASGISNFFSLLENYQVSQWLFSAKLSERFCPSEQLYKGLLRILFKEPQSCRLKQPASWDTAPCQVILAAPLRGRVCPLVGTKPVSA